MADEAKGLRARLVNIKVASKTMALKVQTERRTVDMERVAEMTRTERTKRTKHTDQILQSDGDLHKLKGKSNFSGRHNDIADPHYSRLSDECDSMKCELASGRAFRKEMVQRLENASKNVNTSIGDLSCPIGHAQKIGSKCLSQ